MSDSLHSGSNAGFSKPVSSFALFRFGTSGPSLWLTTLGFSLAAIVIMALGNFGQNLDYIGPDNDDVMRLVQVRDLLAGQSWFDLHQYRLGLDGGTLMHWSRFIDAPIALLILLFSLFLSPEQAEIAGVSVWPLTLVFPLIWAFGKGGFFLGGRPNMLIAQGISALFVVTVHRFHPGSIDHHNAQMALVAVLAAMLLDPQRKASSFAIAGFAAALALAIGAETTPLIAVASLVVALLWGMLGQPYQRAAMAYGASLATCVALAFLVTTPPPLYSAVTCDSLSIGFASLAVAGGVFLALAASLMNGKGLTGRFVSLGLCGALVTGLLLKIAPQCLHNPLDSLDPLLQTMWLQHVSEAQTIFSEFLIDPATIGSFYAVGFLGMVVCLARIIRNENRSAHAILLVLLTLSFMIACYQIRASIFSNILAIFPLSLAIADLQRLSRADPKNTKKGLAYLAMVLASVPGVWGISGILANEGLAGVNNQWKSEGNHASKICRSEADMQQLAELPAGLVANPSNLGAHILRYTAQRSLSAPYHRNPNGMLTELNIEMAPPADAEKIIRATGVTYFALCLQDHETDLIKQTRPDGFVANLIDGKVPGFMEKLPQAPGSGLTVYRVLPKISS